MKKTEKRKNRKAFTLLEIIAVIALIALLLSLVVTNSGALFSSSQEKVASMYVKSSLEAPLLMYRTDIGSYPSTEEGLAALMKAPESAGARWKGPYLKNTSLLDPWKKPYRYAYPGVRNPGTYDLWSLGPDGVESADDIGNWETE